MKIRVDRASLAFLASISLMALLPFLQSCSTTSPSGLKGPNKEDQIVDLYINSANSALMERDTVTALEYLKKAEDIRPSEPAIYHTRALAFIVLNDYPTAIIWAKKSVTLNPLYSPGNNTLGKLLMDTGKPDEAIPYLTAAARDSMNREAFKAYTNLGILYYRKLEFKMAEESLNRAITQSPNNACVAYYYRGHLDLQKKNYTSAIKDYDDATRGFCAEFAEAHLAAGIALERSGQYQAARKKYLEVRDHFSNTPIADQATEHLKFLP